MRFILLFLFIVCQAHAQQQPTDSASIELLLRQSQSFVNKPGEDPADLKHAADLASQALQLSDNNHLHNEQSRSYVLLAQIAREKGDDSNAGKYLDKAVQLLPYIAPWPAAAGVYLERSTQQVMSGGPEGLPKATDYGLYYDIYRYHETDTIKLANATKLYADLLSQAEKNAKALYHAKLALELYKTQHYRQVQDVYELMAFIISDMGNLTEAIRYALLAKKTAEAANDSTSTTACSIYNKLCTYYVLIGNNEEARKMGEKAYKIAKQLPDKGNLALVASNLSQAYVHLAQPEKAAQIINVAIRECPPGRNDLFNQLQLRRCINYIYGRDYHAALEVFLKMEFLIHDPSESQSLHLTMAQCGVEIYQQLKNYPKAAHYIRELESLRSEGNTLLLNTVIERRHYKLDSAQGKFASAIQHLNRYKTYDDSLKMIRHDRELAQLQVEYETEKKDHDLKMQEKHISMLTVETNQQKEQIHSDTIKRNFTYAIALLLLLLLSIAFWAYQTKRRSNVKLQEQQFEINQQNTILKQLLEEREWLLKEVHHRVKNNLQIVISLLNSQARHLNSESAKQALRESKNRMQAISIIHQKLYKSDSFSSVNMDFYIRELLDFLQDSFSIHDIVAIDTDCTDIDVSQAVPIGLIINEAVTNAIKYAVPHTSDPRINISMTCKEEVVALSIADNGPGMPTGFHAQHSDSFGISLIMGLVRQLRGTAVFANDGGTHIHITFKRTKVLA